MRKKTGFTLIELLVSLAIIALLSTIALPLAQVARQRIQEQELRRSLNEMRAAIDAYKQASDDGRIEKKLGSNGYPENLEILVRGVENQRHPKRQKIYFLRRIPIDPFSPPPINLEEGNWGKRSYSSEANSPEEGEDVYDVYSLSKLNGLNGVPYKKW